MKSGFLMSIVLLLAGLSCSTSGQPDVTETPAMNVSSDKILIVYLSRTKNTKAVAEMIQQKVGGKLVALELQNPYPSDYQTTVDQVARENASGFMPPLVTRIDSMEKYDIVFLGFPTWGMQMPPPIKSFLANYNLKGKTIVPFNTNAGYGIGTSFDQVKSLAAGSNVLNGFSTQGGIERDGVLFVMQGDKQVQVVSEVARWLQGLKLP